MCHRNLGKSIIRIKLLNGKINNQPTNCDLSFLGVYRVSCSSDEKSNEAIGYFLTHNIKLKAKNFLFTRQA